MPTTTIKDLPADNHEYDVEVEYICLSSGHDATHTDPAEPPLFEWSIVAVHEIVDYSVVEGVGITLDIAAIENLSDKRFCQEVDEILRQWCADDITLRIAEHWYECQADAA